MLSLQVHYAVLGYLGAYLSRSGSRSALAPGDRHYSRLFVRRRARGLAPRADLTLARASVQEFGLSTRQQAIEVGQ